MIDPDHATAQDIAQALLLPGAVSVEYFGDGRLGLAEVIVDREVAARGQPLAKRDRVEPSYIVGWSRGGEAQLAKGEDVLEPGDHLIVVAAREHLARRWPVRRPGPRGQAPDRLRRRPDRHSAWRRSSRRRRSG